MVHKKFNTYWKDEGLRKNNVDYNMYQMIKGDEIFTWFVDDFNKDLISMWMIWYYLRMML
jgi:hypothetical protein